MKLLNFSAAKYESSGSLGRLLRTTTDGQTTSAAEDRTWRISSQTSNLAPTGRSLDNDTSAPEAETFFTIPECHSDPSEARNLTGTGRSNRFILGTWTFAPPHLSIRHPVTCRLTRPYGPVGHVRKGPEGRAEPTPSVLKSRKPALDRRFQALFWEGGQIYCCSKFGNVRKQDTATMANRLRMGSLSR